MTSSPCFSLCDEIAQASCSFYFSTIIFTATGVVECKHIKSVPVQLTLISCLSWVSRKLASCIELPSASLIQMIPVCSSRRMTLSQMVMATFMSRTWLYINLMGSQPVFSVLWWRPNKPDVSAWEWHFYWKWYHVLGTFIILWGLVGPIRCDKCTI